MPPIPTIDAQFLLQWILAVACDIGYMTHPIDENTAREILLVDNLINDILNAVDTFTVNFNYLAINFN